MGAGCCCCGAVRLEISRPLTQVTYCHCSKCRRWHGHVGAWCAVERGGFRLVESRGLKWHQVSPTVRRGFCGECGSSLLWDDAGDAERISICAGVLDAPTGTYEKAHIYVGSKGDYYEIAGDLPRYDAI